MEEGREEGDEGLGGLGGETERERGLGEEEKGTKTQPSLNSSYLGMVEAGSVVSSTGVLRTEDHKYEKDIRGGYT